MARAGAWIAGGLAALAGMVGIAALVWPRKKTPIVPPPQRYEPSTSAKTSAGAGLTPGVGAETTENPTVVWQSGGVGRFLDLGLSILGLNLGLADLLATPQAITERIYFPEVYPTELGDFDLSKTGEGAAFKAVAPSVMADQDKAFAGFYQIWPAVRRMREWFGARGIPFLMISQKPVGWVEVWRPGVGVKPAPGDLLFRGQGVRLAPAMISRYPEEARSGNLLWIPLDEYPTFGERALQSKDKSTAAKGEPAVWDGARRQWTSVPWESFGLTWGADEGPLIVHSYGNPDTHFENKALSGTPEDKADLLAAISILRQTFTS